jgi:L-proline amide hydrolase
MTDLARGGRAVVFYDQTGNGKSTHFPDRGADFYTIGLFARELDNLISHLGISDRYHVLGQYWGGMLAQERAITPPPGLRSVILSNTAASFVGFAAEANALRACGCRKPMPPGDIHESRPRRGHAAGPGNGPGR